MSLLSSSITGIEVDTSLFPPIIVNDPFGASVPSSSGFASFFLGIVKPKITVHTAFGDQTSAPWGKPGNSSWPLVLVVIGLLFGGVLLWRLK